MSDLPAPALSAPTLTRLRDKAASADRRAALRRWWRRRPVNRALVLLHRWPSLVLGLLLVLECTSGAVLLYHGELFRASHGGLYKHTASAHPIAAEQAIGIVHSAQPSFDASWVATDDGVYVVGDAAYRTVWFVDPGTGHVNGSANTDGGFLGLMVNLHDCAFSCAGYPGYVSWLADPVWSGGPTFLTGITWGAMVLGVLGLLMILLVASGIKIWWPGIKRLRSRFVVRTDRGRFARDYDLHNVIAAVTLPFVLMWGVTGAAFEFPVVEKAWLAVTGGDQPATEDFSITPRTVPAGTPTITAQQAVTAALTQVPGEAAFIGLPTKDAPYYEIDVQSGYGSRAYRAIYHGDAYVLVDQHDAGHLKVLEFGRGEAAANRFYDKYLEPTHFGWNVNGWWRIVWLVMGLAPLALFVTGVSTWLYRRGVRRRRAAAQ